MSEVSGWEVKRVVPDISLLLSLIVCNDKNRMQSLIMFWTSNEIIVKQKIYIIPIQVNAIRMLYEFHYGPQVTESARNIIMCIKAP